MSERKSKLVVTKPDSPQKELGELLLDPDLNSSNALSAIAITPKDNTGESMILDGNGAYYALKEANKQIKNGNLEEIETLLANQIRVLDSLFARHVLLAHKTDRVDLLKIYSNIAFTAQRQCRATVEALAEIKNPKPYIQNNKAQYQQVNNGALYPHARDENSKTTNELLEDQSNDGQWLDTRAQEAAGRNDKELETVGAKHGAED